MKNIEIFEPAMCCSTGLCGPGIDPELLRISTLINALSQKGITIKRYNLTSDPQEFVSKTVINEQLAKNGVKKLPITLVDGVITKTGSYPTNKEFSEWTGATIEQAEPKKKSNSCCCGGGSECC